MVFIFFGQDLHFFFNKNKKKIYYSTFKYANQINQLVSIFADAAVPAT